MISGLLIDRRSSRKISRFVAVPNWTARVWHITFALQFHSMPQFSYRARNAQGALVEGVLNVADRSVAIRQIEQQHCIPIRIEAMAAGPETVDRQPAAAP